MYERILFTSAVLSLGAVAAQAAVLDHSAFVAADNVEGSSSLGPSGQTATTITMVGNSDRTAVSPDAFSGALTYSGDWRATGGDNDTIGVTFGYVDGNNNYRLGWEGGGDWDFETGNASTGGNGLWLIQETDGVATELFEVALNWVLNVQYSFSITLDGNDGIEFSVMDGMTTLASGSVTGSRSTDGQVGVYANSQAAVFGNLDVTPASVSTVPLPAGLPLLLAGLGGIGLLRREKA